jgi:hypothetical protein
MLLAACTTHGMMGSGPMEGQLEQAQEELDRHHGAVMAATSLPEVFEEAGMHDSSMGQVMDGMNDAMGGMMSHCSGSGMDEMHDGMSGMHSEMRDHIGALETAADLGSAQSLCESHVGEMRQMLAGMQHALGRSGCRMMAP